MSGRIVQKFRKTRLQQLMCGFHCHAAGSHLAIDHLLGWLKQHLAGCRVPVRDWLRLTRDRFLLRKDLKLVPVSYKCIPVLDDCVLKNNDTPVE